MRARLGIIVVLAAVAVSVPAVSWSQPMDPAVAPTGAPAPAAAVSSSGRLAKNSVYAEGLGAGILWSINYERAVLDFLSARVGFSYYSFSATAGGQTAKAHYALFPIMANYLGIGSGSHSLELGAGATIAYVSASASNFGLSASASGVTALGTLVAGYRLQPRDGGFHFRVGVTGLYGPGLGFSVDNPSDWGIIPLPHISFGGVF